MKESRPPGSVRPSIPPLVWSTAGVWAGSAAATYGAWMLHASGRSVAWVWVAVAILVASGVALRAVARHRGRTTRWSVVWLLAAAWCVASALGAASAVLHATWAFDQADRASRMGPVMWTGVVVADPSDGIGGSRVTVALRDGPLGGRYALRWPAGAPVPEYGVRVRFWSRIAPASAEDPYALGAFLRGELGSGKPWRTERVGWEPGPLGAAARLRSRCIAVLGAAGVPGSAVVASAVFGRRDVRDEDAFRVVGAAHLLTASGIHLAMATGMAAGLAGWAGLRRPWPSVAGAAAAVAFVLVGGLRTSLVRAALVACGALLPAAAGRRRQALSGGAAAAFVLVTLDPPSGWDVALWIGMTACVGAGVFGGLAADWVRAVLPPRLGKFASAVASTCAVQAMLAPVAAGLFGVLTPLAPVSGPIVAPLLQLSVALALPGAVVGGVSPGLGGTLLRAACAPAGAAAGVVSWLARAGPVAIPCEPWTVPLLAAWAVACVALWVRWPRPRRVWRARAGLAAVCLAAALALRAPPASGPRIVVLDVGQGDAILVQDGPGSMLVDAGPDPLALRRALARAGVSHIGALVLTHAHADHTGGVPGLRGIATVGWVGVPASSEEKPGDDPALASAAGLAPSQSIRAGMEWRVGGWRVSALWPSGNERRLETNDTSVILLVEREGIRALLLGDAESRAQEGAVSRLTSPVDVLKVAHHGSVNGLVPTALEVWRPGTALVSVGAGNRFGHPASRTLAELRRIGARTWRTDLQGDLRITGGPSGWQVSATRSADRVADAVAEQFRRTRTARLCETIEPVPRRHPAPRTSCEGRPDDGRRPERSQARLPDLRLRAAAAGPRGPPSEGAVREGRGPRLQPRDVRRGLGQRR